MPHSPWWYNGLNPTPVLEAFMLAKSEPPSCHSPQKWWVPWLVALILLGALFLRIYGLMWDGGYLFHPDELKHLADGFGADSIDDKFLLHRFVEKLV